MAMEQSEDGAPLRPPRPERLRSQSLPQGHAGAAIPPPPLPTPPVLLPVSARSDIDFDSMLQELVVAESMVSQRLSAHKDGGHAVVGGGGSDTRMQHQHQHHQQRVEVADASMNPKSVLFVDEASQKDLVQRLAAGRSTAASTAMHLPVQAASVTIPAGAATGEDLAAIAAAVALSASASTAAARPPTDPNSEKGRIVATPARMSSSLSSNAFPLASQLPAMAQTIEFNQEEPTLMISHPNIAELDGTTVDAANLRSAILAVDAHSASASARGTASDLRAAVASSAPSSSGLGSAVKILKVRTPSVEPDILPMAPNLDAEDDVDSDEYREIYGDDYDRYNLYSSGDDDDDVVDDESDDSDNQENDNADDKAAGLEYQPEHDETGRDEDIEIHDDRSTSPVDVNDELDAFREHQSTMDRSGSSFQNATLDDYEDVDGLLNMLDKFIRRNRASRLSMTNELGGYSIQNLPKSLFAHQASLPRPDQKYIQSQQQMQPQLVTPASTSAKTQARAVSGKMPSHIEEPNSDEDDMALGILANNLKAKAFEDKATVAHGQAQAVRPAENPVHQLQSPTQPPLQDKVSMILAKLNEADVKKITTRIYIEDARSFKTLVLTSLMSADQVVRDVVARFRLAPSDEWALFELCNDMGIERPLRDWETVTDVISAWDLGTSLNAIVMKKYGYRITLQANSLNGRFPRIQGYLYLELKPGKWQKRFCVLKNSQLYYYQEADKPSTATLLCNLSSFDVYTLSRSRRKMPTEFCFALRSVHNISVFESCDDYSKFICVEKRERLYDWVLALRLARNEQQFLDFPELFEEYDSAISSKAKKRRAAAKGEAYPVAETKIDAQAQGLSGKQPSSSVHAESRKLAHARVESGSKDEAAQHAGVQHQRTPPSASALVGDGNSSVSLSGEDAYRREKERRRAQRAKEATAAASQSLSVGQTGDDDGDGHGQIAMDEEAYRREKERRRRERHDREDRKARSSHATQVPLASGRRTRPRDDARRSLPGSSPTLNGRARAKPLVDISDVKNCRQCGCSEFRLLFNRKEGQCANCLHVHM